MDAELNSTDVNEKMDDGNDNGPKSHDSLNAASKSPIVPIAGQTGSLAEVMSCSELIFTEDTELSSTDISMSVFPNKIMGTLI
ncbi:hypothetical protein GBF38_000507 [Nibea albiflora]|nr:hypothetical protein GBF38_000507 [Nibea albiflora]